MRLVATGMAGWSAAGVGDPRRHVAVVSLLLAVLIILLLSSSIGSLRSSRWPEDTIAPRLRTAIAVLVVVILIHTVLSTPVLQATLKLPLAAQLPVAIALLAVLGVLMGIPFPVGIRWAGRHHPGTVPWLWGMNGVMSVLGSAMATALAIHVGFRLTLFASALVYALALVLISRELRQAPVPVPAPSSR